MAQLSPQALPATYPAVMPILESIGFRDSIAGVFNKRWDNGVSHVDVLMVLILLILDHGGPLPLYEVHRWAEQFGIELLMGLDPAQLHDDKIGYTLDALVPLNETGECDLSWLQELHHRLADRAVRVYQIPVDMLHYDFTDISFSGVYEDSDLLQRGKGPGQRQMQLGLNVTAESGFPVLAPAHPGARNHTVSVPENLAALTEQLEGKSFCVITDSAGVCYDNIVAYEQIGQCFLGPRQLRKWEKEKLTAMADEQFELAEYRSPKGSRYWTRELAWEIAPQNKDGSVTVRALAIISEEKRRNAQAKARGQMSKLLRRLAEIGGYAGSRGHYRRADYVRKQAEKALEKCKHAAAFVQIEVTEGSDGPEFVWSVDWADFAEYRGRLGRYALFTNLPADEHGADDLLELYHGRHVVEAAYRQLKSELEISPMHLHKDNRLYGLAWVYVIALMVLSLLQLVARQAGLTTRRGCPLTARALLKELWSVTALVWRDGGELRATVAPLPERAQLYLEVLGFPSAQHWLTALPCDQQLISGI